MVGVEEFVLKLQLSKGSSTWTKSTKSKVVILKAHGKLSFQLSVGDCLIRLLFKVAAWTGFDQYNELDYVTYVEWSFTFDNGFLNSCCFIWRPGIWDRLSVSRGGDNSKHQDTTFCSSLSDWNKCSGIFQSATQIWRQFEDSTGTEHSSKLDR